MRFGSLFSGIGGLDLGLERAGMECRWQVEIDDYANRVLAKHWPDVRRHDDIRTWPQSDTERVDVICGGFPCQDISYAGRGAGLDGERSGLFFETIRMVRQCQPRYVLLENVAALLTRGLDRVLGTLAEIGYDAEWHCIPAAAVGAPHIRDRVFIIATNTDAQCDECSEAATETNQSIAGHRQTGETPGRGRISADARRICGSLANSHGGGSGATQQHPSNDADSGRHGTQEETILAGRGASELPGWWSAEPDVGRVADGIPSRVDRLKGLGNAVVPQVAEFIGRQIMCNQP